MKASVIGSGAFGTAIASVLATHCDEVQLWGREPKLVRAINEQHQNPTYLPGFSLAEKIRATLDLEEALQGSELVVSVTPSFATREVLGKAGALLPRGVPIVSGSKGIENQTLLTMTEVLEQCLPDALHPYLAVLSGPSFAREVVQGLPTVVTIASRSDEVALRCQKAFATDSFRAYTSSDVIGVELGGALKNVIAIAVGISDGLGFGHNARAALITRGLAEITRIAVRRGANPLTLAGLTGMGDLVLTCTGELSRNRHVGLELGKGRSLEEILAGTQQVAEGVRTAISARDLALRMGVELPICEQVYAIIHEGKNPKEAVVELMRRQPKGELH